MAPANTNTTLHSGGTSIHALWQRWVDQNNVEARSQGGKVKSLQVTLEMHGRGGPQANEVRLELYQPLPVGEAYPARLCRRVHDEVLRPLCVHTGENHWSE